MSEKNEEKKEEFVTTIDSNKKENLIIDREIFLIKNNSITNFKIGDYIEFNNSKTKNTGYIKFIGEIQKNNKLNKVYGIEWEFYNKKLCIHDGIINDIRYFTATKKESSCFIIESDFLKYSKIINNNEKNNEKNSHNNNNEIQINSNNKNNTIEKSNLYRNSINYEKNTHNNNLRKSLNLYSNNNTIPNNNRNSILTLNRNSINYSNNNSSNNEKIINNLKDIKVNDAVTLKELKKKAKIRYIGKLKNEKKELNWIGLEWEEEGIGKNDGMAFEVRYYQTKPLSSTFIEENIFFEKFLLIENNEKNINNNNVNNNEEEISEKEKEEIKKEELFKFQKEIKKYKTKIVLKLEKNEYFGGEQINGIINIFGYSNKDFNDKTKLPSLNFKLKCYQTIIINTEKSSYQCKKYFFDMNKLNYLDLKQRKIGEEFILTTGIIEICKLPTNISISCNNRYGKTFESMIKVFFI
jgi:hypothetical protein